MAVLHVHDLGDPTGEPVLAVHGISGHGRRYRRLAEEGWPGRRTVAVDLRGHGRSTWAAPWSIPQHVADLVDTLDALDLRAPVDVVGHSFGGTIGLALLAHQPSRVRSLALLDPALARPGDAALELAGAAIAHTGWMSVEEATAARNQGLGDQIHPAVVEDVTEHLVLGDDGRYRFRFAVPAVVTAWGEVCTPLPAVVQPVPTLLVVAARAGMVAPAVEQGLRDLLGARLHVERIDAGHMLYWERHDETLDAIERFWSTTRTG